MATSPTPFSNVVMDSRAPLSMIETLRKTAARNSLGRRLVARGRPGVTPQRRAIDGVDVPHGPAGGLGVGRQDVDARTRQIGPVANVLGVALADGENDDRGRDHAPVRPGLPVVADQLFLGDLLDVRFERERRDVGVEASDDGPGLRAAALVRLPKRHITPGLPLPRLLERRDDRLSVRLSRRRVGRQDELGLRPGGGRCPRVFAVSRPFAPAAAAGGRQKEEDGNGCRNSSETRLGPRRHASTSVANGDTSSPRRPCYIAGVSPGIRRP